MKKRLVESNSHSDQSGKVEAASAKQREDAQPVQTRRTVHKRGANDDDWFDKLEEAEYESCYQHEMHRERLDWRLARIVVELAELEPV